MGAAISSENDGSETLSEIKTTAADVGVELADRCATVEDNLSVGVQFSGHRLHQTAHRQPATGQRGLATRLSVSCDLTKVLTGHQTAHVDRPAGRLQIQHRMAGHPPRGKTGVDLVCYTYVGGQEGSSYHPFSRPRRPPTCRS